MSNKLLLTKKEVAKAVLASYSGLDPEFDIDYEAIEVANKAQLKEAVEWLEQKRVRLPNGYLPEIITYKIGRDERQALLKEAGLE